MIDPSSTDHNHPSMMSDHPQLYSTLAEANLLRIRGLWDSAIDLCLTAMKTAPGEVCTYSLLGDIYQDMGDTAESARWYTLALGREPNSVADRLKLERLNVRSAKHKAKWYGIYDNPSLFVKYVTIVLSICVAMAIIVGSITHIRSGTQPTSADPTVIAPSVLIDSATTADMSTQAGINVPVARTETDILNALEATSNGKSSPVKNFNVEQDPRSGVVTITAQMVEQIVTQANVLDGANYVASALESVSATDALKTATIRITVGDTSGSPYAAPDLLFAADYTVGLVGQSGIATSNRVPTGIGANGFSQIWWAPGLEYRPSNNH